MAKEIHGPYPINVIETLNQEMFEWKEMRPLYFMAMSPLLDRCFYIDCNNNTLSSMGYVSFGLFNIDEMITEQYVVITKTTEFEDRPLIHLA